MVGKNLSNSNKQFNLAFWIVYTPSISIILLYSLDWLLKAIGIHEEITHFHQYFIYFGTLFFLIGISYVFGIVGVKYRKTVTKYSLIIWAFIFAFAGTASFTVFSALYIEEAPSIEVEGYIVSLSVSLWANLAFFATLSAVVFLMQQSEFDKNRKSKQRVESLFNRRDGLDLAEVEYLLNKVKEIATDHLAQRLSFTINKHEKDKSLIKITQIRDFIVSNYTTDVEAVYTPELILGIDEMPDNRAPGILQYFKRIGPVKRQLISEKKDKLVRKNLEKLNKEDGHMIKPGPIEFDIKDKEFLLKEDGLIVKPDETYVYRVKSEFWLPYDKEDYTLTLTKHWNIISFSVENDQPDPFEFIVKYMKVDKKEGLKEDTSVTKNLQLGDEFPINEFVSVEPGSKVRLKFKIGALSESVDKPVK